VVLDQEWVDPRYTMISHKIMTLLQDDAVPELPALGASMPVEVDAEEIIQAVEAAMMLMNIERANDSATSNFLQLVRIRDASQQVVAGMMYTVHVEVGTTACLASEVENESQAHCTVVGATSMHELVIVDQPWQSERYELVSHSSATETNVPPATTATESDGSQDRHLEVTDVKMLSALQAGMALLNAESNTKFVYQSVRVVEATVENEEASGFMYTMLVEIGLSECLKTDEAQSVDECPVTTESQFLKLKVLNKPWAAAEARYTLKNHPLQKPAAACGPAPTCSHACSQYSTLPNGCQDGCRCATEISDNDSTAYFAMAAIFGAAVGAIILGGSVLYMTNCAWPRALIGQDPQLAVPTTVTGTALEKQYAAVNQL